ncbi:unnamed protein product, partial [Brassica rapa subsp. trilocularis]
CILQNYFLIILILFSIVEAGEEYHLDSWVPLCTVALEVPKPRMAYAFSVLRDLKLPVNGYAMDIVLLSSLPFVKSFFFFL